MIFIVPRIIVYQKQIIKNEYNCKLEVARRSINKSIVQ